MKKIYAAFLLSLASLSANAMIHVINVANNTFSPNSFQDVIVGDTVRFIQTAGSHNTISQIIPAGAAAWSHSFSTGTTFDYKVTVAGNYAYHCSIHLLMVGAFVATDPVADVADIDNLVVSKAYPNPFRAKISITHKTAETIEVFSMLGERVKLISIVGADKTTVLDLSDLKKGVYFYVIKNNDLILETRRIIKSE